MQFPAKQSIILGGEEALTAAAVAAAVLKCWSAFSIGKVWGYLFHMYVMIRDNVL